MCTNCFVIGKKSIREERKEHNFQTDENIALLYLKRKKKTNFSELTQVFCGYCLYCLITSKRKQNASVPHLLLFPVSSHNAMHSPSRWRESAFRDETK